MTTSNQLRKQFLEFFQKRDHQIVNSSPLIPGNDATLLFTNAGMVQFKDVFLGDDQRSYQRATTSQRCVRAGGKHNDLENVGYTARHHTFFEMLGNFSFGDYFKKEAIAYAWEFLTVELKLPAEKLWVTVFEEDQEAADIWLKDIGVDPERLSFIGAKDNFWQMGDTGPCGPCSEIFYDHGEHVWGGPPGTPEEDGDRYIEIWNLVFMQYDRAADGTLNPLPKPSVDTGMGLERLAAILQNVHANYEIDLFVRLLQAVQTATGTADTDITSSHKVIADHIRSTAFLIVDGVLPSNEGRGYVLRRIIRRAIRHGYKLGCSTTFFSTLVAPLVAEMGEAYPELAKAQAHVEKVLLKEEQRFAETLDQGMKLLEAAIAELPDNTIPGDVVFKLYDTYGFPVDLTNDIARERKLDIDQAGFETAMQAQRDGSRKGSKFANTHDKSLKVATGSAFSGYDHLEDSGTITALIRDGQLVTELQANQHGAVILDNTPFYAESGGQTGDSGELSNANCRFTVQDTQKQASETTPPGHAHHGVVAQGSLKVGDTLTANVNSGQRQAIVANHTATHLLHAALRSTLGEHVQQKGSAVAADKLRFDFSHYEPMTAAQVSDIEQQVNQQIRLNTPAQTIETNYDDAVAQGAMALFGEKYGDTVRVMKIGDYSTELCGGTHVQQAGDIGLFKITLETGVAAGVRRLEAVTANAAIDWLQTQERQAQEVAGLLKTSPDGLLDKVKQTLDRNRELEKDIQRLQQKLASGESNDLSANAVDIAGAKVVAAVLDGVDVKTLRDAMDKLKTKLGSAVVVLGANEDGKVRLVAGVSADLTKKVKAGELVNMVAQQVGGKGGGRPDMAQAGGDQPENLADALGSVAQWVTDKLA